MTLISTSKPYKRLGFDKLEVAEIVTKLNTALCSYQVFYHKVQNFHWNVVGSDFFDIHEITEDLYKNSVSDIDKIAERIRVFDETPSYRLSSYIRDSLVKETSHAKSGEYMINELTSDLQILIESLLDVHDYASRNGDVSSTKLATDIISNLETYHWKLSAWMNRKYQK